MPVAPRIDEVVALLEAYVLDGLDLPRERVMAALRLLDLMIDDARPHDDGAEVLMLMSADDRVIWKFPRKFVS
jgi:hypothetical protein